MDTVVHSRSDCMVERVRRSLPWHSLASGLRGDHGACKAYAGPHTERAVMSRIILEG